MSKRRLSIPYASSPSPPRTQHQTSSLLSPPVLSLPITRPRSPSRSGTVTVRSPFVKKGGALSSLLGLDPSSSHDRKSPSLFESLDLLGACNVCGGGHGEGSEGGCLKYGWSEGFEDAKCTHCGCSPRQHIQRDTAPSPSSFPPSPSSSRPMSEEEKRKEKRAGEKKEEIEKKRRKWEKWEKKWAKDALSLSERKENISKLVGECDVCDPDVCDRYVLPGEDTSCLLCACPPFYHTFRPTPSSSPSNFNPSSLSPSSSSPSPSSSPSLLLLSSSSSLLQFSPSSSLPPLTLPFPLPLFLSLRDEAALLLGCEGGCRKCKKYIADLASPPLFLCSSCSCPPLSHPKGSASVPLLPLKGEESRSELAEIGKCSEENDDFEFELTGRLVDAFEDVVTSHTEIQISFYQFVRSHTNRNLETVTLWISFLQDIRSYLSLFGKGIEEKGDEGGEDERAKEKVRGERKVERGVFALRIYYTYLSPASPLSLSPALTLTSTSLSSCTLRLRKGEFKRDLFSDVTREVEEKVTDVFSEWYRSLFFSMPSRDYSISMEREEKIYELIGSVTTPLPPIPPLIVVASSSKSRFSFISDSSPLSSPASARSPSDTSQFYGDKNGSEMEGRDDDPGLHSSNTLTDPKGGRPKSRGKRPKRSMVQKGSEISDGLANENKLLESSSSSSLLPQSSSTVASSTSPTPTSTSLPSSSSAPTTAPLSHSQSFSSRPKSSHRNSVIATKNSDENPLSQSVGGDSKEKRRLSRKEQKRSETVTISKVPMGKEEKSEDRGKIKGDNQGGTPPRGAAVSGTQTKSSSSLDSQGRSRPKSSVMRTSPIPNT